MTTFDRFDPVERRIGEALEGIVPSRPLDYLDDLFRQTARSSQRPRWSFPERWFNVDITFPGSIQVGRVPLRSVLVLALVLAMAAAAAVYVGTQPRLPLPYGPAANGQLVYGNGGDIYIRDSLTSDPRLLVSGPSEQGGVLVSPDGRLMAYDNVVDDVNHAWVAGIDGSNPRQILDRPFTGLTFQWSNDSRSVVAITDSAGTYELWVAPADGSGAREIELEGLLPREATWDPIRPDVLLVRGENLENGQVDLFYVDVARDGRAVMSTIDMPNGPVLYGGKWEFVGIAFSPDGSTIAYAVPEGDTSENAHFQTWLMARDGTGARKVEGIVDETFNLSWPVFSPDGKSVAMESWFSTQGGGVNTLAVAPTDLSAPAILVGPSVEHSLLKSWSPDGTRLLVHAVDTGHVYSIDPVTRAYEQLPFDLDYVPGWQRLAP
jgi:Tol biopolymer transport system component